MKKPIPESGKPSESRHDIVVIGASLGGVDALQRLVAGLPASLPAAVFVVMHLSPDYKSVLPELLSRAGPLPVLHAVDGVSIEPGHIYVAPPDHHLLLEPGVMRLSAGPRENFSRPAIDPLFRSAAQVYGSRVVGVILSGTLNDGSAGLWEIKQHGGTAVVQAPQDAAFPAMPRNALNNVPIDYMLPAVEIPPLLTRLATETPVRKEPEDLTMAAEEKPGDDAVQRDMAAQVSGQRDGELAVYTCPECSGALWQINAGELIHFRCHVGHMYSASKLLEGQIENLERSLWYAVRTLRDKANLSRQLATDAAESGNPELAERFTKKAQMDEEHKTMLEQLLPELTAANRTQ